MRDAIATVFRGRISAKCAVALFRGRISAKCASLSRGRISAKCATTTRSGSALLIVLGMLSFMVISGLAFSVYMRSTRMPASFVRRTVLTRELAKAALAEAIDAIDQSVRDDPHPGIRPNGSNNTNNYWIGRVLVGDPLVRDTLLNESSGVDTEADEDVLTTTQVLTLEALAYLPPPLVNEARYYGRKSPTSTWHAFDFDAGRYAFIALDVSDYFDVNRLVADLPRSSNPARRVTFGYAFDNDAHTGSRSGGATAWDSFLAQETGRTFNEETGLFSFSKTPFISLADFNLALGSQTAGIGDFKSPFVPFAKQNGGVGFYDSEPDDAQFERYGQMTFVTDSLDAPLDHTDGTTTFDLDTEDGQPFTEDYLKTAPNERSASQVLEDNGNDIVCKLLYKNYISACGLLALCDYLDTDDVPTSLALPTTERVPMVCAVRPMLGKDGLKVVVSRKFSDEKPTEETETTRYMQRTVTVSYKMTGEIVVDAWTAFPFRDRTGFKDGYAADCRAAVFLSSDEMGLRTSKPGGDVEDCLRAPKLSKAELINGVANLFAKNVACPTKKISEPKDAVQQTGQFDLGDVENVFSDEGLTALKLTYRWKQTRDPEAKNPQWEPTAPKQASDCEIVGTPEVNFSVLKATGAVDPESQKVLLGDAVKNLKTVADIKPGIVRLNLALWLAVRCSDGDVVDLVPACMMDDVDYNNANYDDGFTEGFFEKATGMKAPLLKFADADATPFGLLLKAEDLLSQTEGDGDTVHAYQLANNDGLIVRDPRYNYAPENWIAASATIAADGQYWLDNTGCSDSGCDGDIFMATSDQGYLQSITELAFLPRFTDLSGTLDDNGVPNTDVGYLNNPETTWTGKDYPAKGNEAQANMMWRTYNPFDGAENYDGFAGNEKKTGLLSVFHHHGKGLRVNPYSDSTNVIMAAFANTPFSWRVASGNDDTAINKLADEDAENFNKTYTWNGYSSTPSEQKISWADLEDVAGAFMGEVSAAVRDGDTWETALQDVFTDYRTDNEKQLLGIELEESGRFYSVDKKFLFGFWRNCFAARQQLYLVFFRAEPLMLGGGVAGVTPPQLGAKGVAVVWRDPNKTEGSVQDDPEGLDYIPHRTRVLFYHQFE